MKFLMLYFVVFLFVEVEMTTYSCTTTYTYKRRCSRYRFSGDCQPWQLQLCPVERVVQRDYRCPQFSCVSKKIMLYCLELAMFFGEILNASCADINRIADIHSFCRYEITSLTFVCRYEFL